MLFNSVACRISNKYYNIARQLAPQLFQFDCRVWLYSIIGGFSVVFRVKSSRGRRLALKRMAVNNDNDLYLARQEIAIMVRLVKCHVIFGPPCRL